MFEWDEAKSRRNFVQRGFDFEFAAQIFDGDTLEYDDTRREYGERRVVSIGEIEGEVFVIVYTWRGEYRRIISARHADRRERDAYRQAFGKGNS
ncbi:MAG: BrnT family toxin [Candidatus Binataceae bacterium]